MIPILLTLSAALPACDARPVAPAPRTAARTFVGSFAVPAERRDEVIDVLKEKKLLGAFVPDGAAPHTLLYRGPKADYEAALDAVNRHLHPEWYQPRPRVVPRKP